MAVSYTLLQLDPADGELFVARGTLVCQWATAAGFPTLEIIDGEISAKRTLLEAVNVARARRSERQRTARFGAILDAIDEGIVVYDAQGKVNLITPSAESLLNCAKKEALGEHIRTVMPGVFSAVYKRQLPRSARLPRRCGKVRRRLSAL